MKTITLLCGLLLLAACADHVPAVINASTAPSNRTDECPRADGNPCL